MAIRVWSSTGTESHRGGTGDPLGEAIELTQKRRRRFRQVEGVGVDGDAGVADFVGGGLGVPLGVDEVTFG